MPPPDKEETEELDTSFSDTDALAVTPSNADEEPEAGITYFIDEEGHYYYQTAGENSAILSMPSLTQDAEDLGENQVLVEGEGYQTLTLVPSATNTGEVSYVLVVQEEPKPMVNIDIKINEDKNEDTKDVDVYNFNDDESANQESPEKKKTKRKHSIRSFTCNFCPYTSHRRYLLLRHMKCHSEERPHKCGVCERGFKTLASLQNHVNMHNGVKPHVCKYCKSPFTTSGELVRHVRYKHTHEKPHKCTECDYASVELSKLRRHVRCHTGERPYQCPNCTYASPDTFKLKRHLRTHTGEKPYKCDSCSMCFTQSNSLKAHKLIHNVSEKPVFPCELCPAKCSRKTDLRVHVQKLHTSDKPLKCKRCGKTFPDRYSCKVHNKTHEGEKCFKCELCPYASTTIRHLKSHILKHTDEKPFACTECDQTFRQKQLLRRHQNLYHNPNYVPKEPKEKTHTCHECKRTFAHKGNLIRHLAVHDPDAEHHEQALALKIGRTKKVAFDHEQQELESGSGPSTLATVQNNEELITDLRNSKYVAVSKGDNHQYVVLEVIQLEDGTEQVAVVAPDYIQEENEDEEMDEDEDDEQEVEEEEEEEEIETENKFITDEQIEILRRPPEDPLEKSIKLEKDVQSCFGFDEEDEEELDDEDAFNDKLVLRLV